MDLDDNSFEQDICMYFDKIKALLSPEIWQNVLLDCSKNELFVLWMLYRNEEVNMTQIAEYIHVPLNTATGIISRMEKKELVSRNRSAEDKRIVTIQMGKKGGAQIGAVIKEIAFYGQMIVKEFSGEELRLLAKLCDTVLSVLTRERVKDNPERKMRKIIIE